jgi:ABC-type lipoprotein export system ATPase subunit
MELFRQLNQEDGITVILVTHDQEVAKNARRAVVIRDGQVICDSKEFSQAIEVLHAQEKKAA